jgi:hypothetical protein
MENILPVPEINLPVFDQKSACYGSKVCPRSEALRGFFFAPGERFSALASPQKGPESAMVSRPLVFLLYRNQLLMLGCVLCKFEL